MHKSKAGHGEGAIVRVNRKCEHIAGEVAQMSI